MVTDVLAPKNGLLNVQDLSHCWSAKPKSFEELVVYDGLVTATVIALISMSGINRTERCGRFPNRFQGGGFLH